MILVADHISQAKNRLREQYKGKPNLDALLGALVLEVQNLENLIYGMSDLVNIYTAFGKQLDLLGVLLDKPREGLTDELYRIVLLAKVAQNISKGTAEDVVSVFKLLMRARLVYIQDEQPAKINLTAIGSQPIGTNAQIKQAVKEAVAAGVAIETFVVANDPAFSFFEDTDPNGQGFGDITDLSVGGFLSSII